MLRAIGLNNQPVLKIDEIGDIVIDDDLPFELVANEALCAKKRPYAALSFSRICAHRPSAGEQDLS